MSSTVGDVRNHCHHLRAMLNFIINKVKLLSCFPFEQIFDDADKSELSCIIVDDIERLLGMATAVFCGS